MHHNRVMCSSMRTGYLGLAQVQVLEDLHLTSRIKLYSGRKMILWLAYTRANSNLATWKVQRLTFTWNFNSMYGQSARKLVFKLLVRQLIRPSRLEACSPSSCLLQNSQMSHVRAPRNTSFYQRRVLISARFLTTHIRQFWSTLQEILIQQDKLRNSE